MTWVWPRRWAESTADSAWDGWMKLNQEATLFFKPPAREVDAETGDEVSRWKLEFEFEFAR